MTVIGALLHKYARWLVQLTELFAVLSALVMASKLDNKEQEIPERLYKGDPAMWRLYEGKDVTVDEMVAYGRRLEVPGVYTLQSRLKLWIEPGSPAYLIYTLLYHVDTTYDAQKLGLWLEKEYYERFKRSFKEKCAAISPPCSPPTAVVAVVGNAFINCHGSDPTYYCKNDDSSCMACKLMYESGRESTYLEK